MPRFLCLRLPQWIALALVFAVFGPASTAMASRLDARLEAPPEGFRRARALARLWYCEDSLAALAALPRPLSAAWDTRVRVLAAQCHLRLAEGEIQRVRTSPEFSAATGMPAGVRAHAQAALQELAASPSPPAVLAPLVARLRTLALAWAGEPSGADSLRVGAGANEVSILVARAEATSADPTATAEQKSDAWQRVYRFSGRGAPKDLALAMLLVFAPSQASTWAEKLLVHYPESPYAAWPSVRAAMAQLSDADRWKRAQNLWDARAYELAVDEYAHFAPSTDGPVRSERVQEAHLLLGRLFSERMRTDYERAGRHFVAAERGPDTAMSASAAYKAGLIEGKLGRTDEAVQALAAFRARYPGAKDFDEAGFEIGRHLMEGGRFTEAAAHWRSWLAGAKGLRDRTKFDWFEPLALFRAADHEAALAEFAPLTRSRRTLVGDKALYFQGKSEWALSRRADALTSWRRVRANYPYGYYAWLAEEALRGAGEVVPPSPDFSGVPAEPAYPRAALAAAKGALRSELADVLDLAAVGEVAEARERWEAISGRVSRQLGAKADDLRSGWAQWLETVYRDRKSARSKHSRAVRSAPTRGTVDSWRTLFPLAYRDLAEAAAHKTGVSAYQLYAHMLQESRYGEMMVSGANAYGLIQILPSTGRLLARDEGLPFSHPDDLFDPGYNVRLAAAYLAGLNGRFRGQLPLSVASYNGGPKLLSFHMKQNPGLDLDILIETLPAHQSRNYTRKVIEHMHRYATIYGTDGSRRALMSQSVAQKTNYDEAPGPEY